ncbi:MAG: hypothetical protein KDB96_15660, partial [Flavobacteriales bacterium]|nr:hypothetical protein [Flavobacteriales bacterium]
HGIDLLTHARIGAGAKGLSTQEQEDCERTVTYLEGLGDAAIAVTDVAMSKEEQEKFLGDYMYGPGPSDGLSVKRNMRDMLAMGKLGAFGGGLYHLGDHVFQYNGVPSVRISFEVSAGVVPSLTIQEPELTVVARKV